MGILLIFLVFVAVGLIGIAALVFAVKKRSLIGFAVAMLTAATVWSFGHLVYLLLFAEPGPLGPEVANSDFILPVLLLVTTLVVLWLWAFSVNPTATKEITTAAVIAVDAAALADAAADHHRKKQAEANADEIERRDR
jgi:hypothetical protein